MLRFTRKTRTLGARRPLPDALAALFGTALLAAQVTIGCTAEPAVPRQPASIPVTTCNDDLSAGSLREVLLHAVSGDTVDMTSLQCSSISLGYGALFVTVDDLTIAGNGQTISGSINQNVLNDLGHGLLSMSTMIDLSYGRYDGFGGCLYSAGSVSIARGSVTDCIASDRGGALYVKGSLTLADSVISGNSVGQHNLPAPTVGGAAFVGGNALVMRSEISGNTATSSTHQSYGGGFFTEGGLTVEYSTFSGNVADTGGALYGGEAATLIDSTLSGNSALNGAAAAINGDASLDSVTIAFNTVTCSPGCSFPYAFGVTGVLGIDNTIAANTDGGDDIHASGLVVGSNNLVVHGIGLPGTLQSDPRLQPLAINGSLLLVQPLTHALGPGSPAIDAGGTTIFTIDERGLPRPSGAAPDIGAYEVQSESNDVIFTDGFD